MLSQPDGTFDYSVTAVDASGNESAPSVPLSVTIDTQAPPTPPPPDLEDGSDSGVSPGDNITSDTTPTFDVATAAYWRLYRNGAG